ncbi:MAG: RNA polymerase sigma factor SigM [Actinomycetes bacterium]
MSEERSDADLLAAHAAGEAGALAVLVQRHQDRLWAVALRTTSDPEEAADALQDAWISVLRNAGTFRGDAAVTTWLHRIVVNACLDRIRRRTSRPTTQLPDDTDGFRSLADPIDRHEQRIEHLEIEAALALLPPDQRAAIVLVDVEGWSVEAAAEVLGVPVGTIKSRCHRARAKLAIQLAHLRNPDATGNVPPGGVISQQRTGEVQL